MTTMLLLFFDKLALVGGTVHTMVAGAAPLPATILIENDQIVAVGADVTVPEGTKRVDVAGMHVIPGLIDGFVNLDPDHDRLYVASGVTLVRDVGNDMTRILAECDRNARERSPGPWIWASGAALDGGRPSTTAAVILNGASEAETQLPRVLAQDGIAFLSFQDGLPITAWKTTIEIAHKSSKQVWGPVPKGAALDDVLESGQDGLYHLDAFLPAGARWETVELDALMPAAEKAAAKKLAVTPTLAVYARRLLEPKADPPELEYLGPFYVESWEREYRVRAKLVNSDVLKVGLKVLEAQSKLVKTLHEKGCRIVPGSAAPNPWLLPGEAFLDELALLRRAGIPDADVLRLATAGAAEAIGASKRGTIERGKIADFVILKEDPSADLAKLRSPAMVVLRGRVLPRAELDTLLNDLKERERKVREAYEKPIEIGELDLPSGDVLLRGEVETRGIGVRVSAEKYALVRRFDGSLVYCGRLFAPGSATTPGTETAIQQTIRNNELAAFDVKIKTNGHEIAVHAESVAGRFSIERRMDGGFVDNVPLNDKIAFVDAGSVTAELILCHHKKPGKLKVLYFEDYEPARADWEMRLDTDGTTHLARTQSGDLKVAFDERGGFKEMVRAAGNTALVTKSLRAEAPDGKGLPMSAEKRALAGKPATGSAPKPNDTPPTPPKKEKDGE
jgi:hypothetical protein